jgi:hypothetical protein
MSTGTCRKRLSDIESAAIGVRSCIYPVPGVIVMTDEHVNANEGNQEVLLHTHELVASFIMYWRRIALDVAVFGATALVAIAGFAISQTRSRILIGSISFLILALGWSAAYIVRLAIGHMDELAQIVVRLDVQLGLFEKDRFLTGDSIYPEEWKLFGAGWHDPLMGFVKRLMIFLPPALVAVLAINAIAW